MNTTSPYALPLIGLVALGGALGSVLRYLIAEATRQLSGFATFPWATFVINVTGSLVLGWLFARATAGQVRVSARAFVMVGVLGGYTTFSTFSVETLTLLQSGALIKAMAYTAGSVGLAVAAAAVGFALGNA